LKETKVNKTY